MQTRWLTIFLAAFLGACSPPRINNTRLGSADLVVMTDQMARSLLSAEPVAGRRPKSELWIITLDRVHNRTNDIIPRREKWAFMARLRAQLSETDALSERNLRFIVPVERAEGFNTHQSNGDADRLPPTHALTATFYALTNATRAGRSDTYLCTFQLLDLSSDRIVWEDTYEVKRAVESNKFD